MKKNMTVFLLLLFFSCDFGEELHFELRAEQGYLPNTPVWIEYDYQPGYNTTMALMVVKIPTEGEDWQDYGWFVPPTGFNQRIDLRDREFTHSPLPQGVYGLLQEPIIHRGNRRYTTSRDFDNFTYFLIDDFDSGTVGAIIMKVWDIESQDGVTGQLIISNNPTSTVPFSGLQVYYKYDPDAAPASPVMPETNAAKAPENKITFDLSEASNPSFLFVGQSPRGDLSQEESWSLAAPLVSSPTIATLTAQFSSYSPFEETVSGSYLFSATKVYLENSNDPSLRRYQKVYRVHTGAFWEFRVNFDNLPPMGSGDWTLFFRNPGQNFWILHGTYTF